MISSGKIKYLLSFIIIIAWGCTKNEPSANQKDDFIKCFGGPFQNEAIDMISDNGYVYVLGNIQDGEEKFHIQISKIDEFGNKIWEKPYGSEGKQTEASQIIKLEHQTGYAIIGSIESDEDNFLFDPYFLIIDENGDTIQEKTYTNSGTYDYGKCVAELENGDFAFCILSKTSDLSTSSIYIQTVTGDGEINKKSGTIPGEDIYQIWKKNDNGGFYISSINSDNPVIIIIDAAGNKEGPQPFITINGKINSIAQIANGGTYVCGQLYNGSNGKTDGFIAKLKNVEASFEYDWIKEYGTTGSDQLTQIIISADNQLLMVGTKENTEINTTDAWILKTDLSGNILNETTLGGDNNDYGIRIIESENNTYLVESTVSFSKQTMIEVAVAKFE